ncbi:MAG: phosphoesterase RecJ domain-containing protein [Microgenomates group bacterium Gr01-1014_5]|nr:MAG: phosphoesterase RecJ domain-containing protein [Microgenomates group bacterium Gr01-1014_5]
MKTYQEAEEILKKIRSCKKILLTLHRGPDADSIGSNLALYQYLKDLGKEVDLISVDEPSRNLSFLEGFPEIKIEDIAEKDLSAFDLILILDSGSPEMLTYKQGFIFSNNEQVIVIDHHKTNTGYGKLNLIDSDTGSVSEIIYKLLEAWGAQMSPGIATSLLTGIIGDTGSFRFESSVSPETFIVASSLLEKRARLGQAVYNLFQSTELATLKYWGVILKNLEIKESNGIKFAFSAVSEDELGYPPSRNTLGVSPRMKAKKFSLRRDSAPDEAWGEDIPTARSRELHIDKSSKSGAATVFFSSVSGTEFGLLLTQDKIAIDGSLRSRSSLDVAVIAEVCGGGGHKAAAGFRYMLDGKSFDEGVRTILDVVNDVLAKQHVENS